MMNHEANSKLWQSSIRDYSQHIQDSGSDSEYLRRTGLCKTVLDLVGACQTKRVLDVGSGSGWLLEQLSPAEGHECDVVISDSHTKSAAFSVQDVRSLAYKADYFDIVISNLVLIWLDDINDACQELYRVARPNGGRLILSLVHPYFYRTGRAASNGDFLITADLSKPFCITSHKIAGHVGPFNYYYRPLCDYINVLIDAKWQISKVREWYVDMDDYRSSNHHSEIQRTGKVPLYCFIECI